MNYALSDYFQVRLPVALNGLIQRFAEHCHDSWALDLIEQGYTFGAQVDEVRRTHPNLRSFSQLPTQVSSHLILDQCNTTGQIRFILLTNNIGSPSVYTTKLKL